MWIDKIRKKAAGSAVRILLPEGFDARVSEAAGIIKKSGIAEVTLVSEEDMPGIDTIRPGADLLKDSARLVSEGAYDGMVAGAAHPTAAVIKAGLKKIGVDSGRAVISSFFLMESQDTALGEDGAMLFSDCAVVPDPDPQKLADIAFTTAMSAKNILGWQPRVAFLSFSTKGSAKHAAVDKVVRAVENLRSKEPDFIFDGEMQFDAAVVPAVSGKKDPEGVLKGRANILIFPDLDSANIGYKIAQRIGGMRAVGPILQGFRKPVNDLSRGCTPEDIADVAAFTAVQASI